MPTFATNTFADQTTPAANEAWTVNAGALAIVAGDYINAAAPNSYTGVNTVNEGKLLIDGRLCWEIGTANTTNAAVGLAVTGGTSGATAVVTQVLASPIRIKFRYTNNLVFQSGETISGGSFSAVANTAPTRSTILYGINAAANGLAVPRLGGLEVRAVWRQLGTATGAANQTLTHWMSGVTAGIWVQKGNTATLTNTSNQIGLTYEFAAGQIVEFATSGSLSGTGFSTGTKYYVVASDWSGLTGQFGSYVSLATTKTGSAIAATGTGTGTIALLASGAIVTFTNGAATITATSGHNRSNGDSLTLSSSGSLPGGFDDINTYWVINSDTTAGTFQLCTDYNPFTGTGTPITATGTGSGTHQLVPDDNYLIWQNIVDRTLTGATAAVGIDLNHGRFFKQTSGSTAIVFGDEGAAAAVTFSTTNASSTLTSSAAHGRAVGDVVRISNPPTPFVANTDYYVLTVPSSTTLTISTNLITAAIAATQTQTNTANLLPQIGGKIPAYGAKVRVPNVAIVATNAANAPAPIISSFVTVANSVGTFLFDKCITAGIQFSSNNLSGFTARFTTFHNFLTLVYVLNPTVFQDVAISSSSGDSTSGINLASQVFDIQNIFSATTNFTALVLTNCLQGSVKGGSTVVFNRANAQLQCLSFTNIGNLPIQKLRYLGGGISLSGGTNENLANLAHSDSVVKGSYTAFPQDSFLGSVSTNTVIDQLQVMAPPKNSLFKTPANTTTIRRVGTSSNPVDLVGQTGSFITFGSVDSFSLIDCFWKNTSASHFAFQTNVVLSNIKMFNSGDNGRAFALGSRLKNIRLKALRGSSFSSTVEGSGLHFYDLFNSTTTGLFGLVFYPKNTDDYFSNLSYTLDADTTPTSTYFINGALQLRTSGNQITYTTPFIQGHTALGALTVTSNNNANYTFSYDLDTGSGFSGSFTTITSGSNLGATIATPATGFRLKIRILATTSATANSITALTVATTSTANAQAAISYPYQASTFVINGLVAGSTVGLFDNNGTLVQAGTATTGSFTFNPIEFFNTANYTLKYRRFGYKEGSITVALTNGTNTNTVAQVVDPFRVLSTAAVSALTGLLLTATDYTQTVTHSRSELYDYSQFIGAQVGNIGNPYAVTTSNGTDLQLAVNYVRGSCTLTGTGSLSLPTKTATITGDTSTGQLPITDSTGLRFRVYGLPTSGSPVMRSKRISNSTITNPTISSSGEAYFTIALGEDYQLRADAIGYAASGFITINSNNDTSLQINLSQFIDSNGTPVYGQGVAGEKALITFNPSTLVIAIAYSASYPTISLYSAFDKIEELLATSTAIEFTAHPIYSNGTIVFPRDIVSNAANPARIQAVASNTGAPTLRFQVIDQANATPYNLFDFSNGKFINYPTTVNLSQDGSGSGSGLTAQQVRDAAALALSSGVTAATGSIDDYTAKVSALIENVSGNRFTAKALEASPAGSGGGTTAQQIADALKLAPATGTPATGSVYNLLNNVPSAVWSNSTRILTAGTNIVLAKGTGLTGLNDLAASDVWAAGTRSLTDKTGFSLSQAFPTNFSSFAITAGGAVTAGSVSDKTGYSLSQAFPTNFSSLAVTAGGSVTAGAVSDKSGYTLSSTGIQAIWDTLTATLTTAGSVGKRVADFVNASINNIPTTDNTSAITAIKGKTDQLAFTTANQIDATAVGVPINPLLTNDSRLTNLDAAISTRSPDADTTTLLSRLTSTRATNLDSLDATISSRLPTSSYTAPDNAAIGTIGTRTARVDALLTNPGSGDRFTATALLNAPVTSVDLSSINTALAAMQGSGFSTSTDSLHALRARGDTAWVTGFGGSDRTTLGNLPTTVYTGVLTTLQSSVNAIPTTVYTSALTALQASVNAIPTIVYTTTLSNLLSATQTIQGKTEQLGFTGSNVNAIALATGGTFPVVPTPPTVVAIRQEMDSNSTKLAAIALTAQDLSDLRGFTAGHPMTADAATGTITANGKTVTVTEDGTTQTYTRS